MLFLLHFIGLLTFASALTLSRLPSFVSVIWSQCFSLSFPALTTFSLTAFFRTSVLGAALDVASARAGAAGGAAPAAAAAAAGPSLALYI